MTLDPSNDSPEDLQEPAQPGLQFVATAACERPGRVKVVVSSECPLCGETIKAGGWGYPNTANGDLDLHHWRCLQEVTHTRREIAQGRTRPAGVPRDVTKAVHTSPCAMGCGHAIYKGHLIERYDERGWRHVKCPTLCVRCERPIAPGQACSPRMPREGGPGQLRVAYGWKHRRCDYADLQARIARDALANTLRQTARAKRLADNRAGIGPAFQRSPEDADAPQLPNPGRISPNRLS